jgi:type VI secretion system secreted protein VgrG
MVLQAQSGPMSLASLRDLTISSTDGKVVITAAKEVWIGAGGSYIQINGCGITNGSPGPILEKGASWDVPGADLKTMPMPQLPYSGPILRYHEQFHLVDDDGETALAHTRYEIESESGKRWNGISDANGFTQHIYTDEPESLSLTVYKEVEDDSEEA